ncbi:MAG TPA: TonB-dependent receptor [Steroidobacteraceae bacterium]|nr:TonB-dependent receptor [Steroidobacteraceae bacterium]
MTGENKKASRATSREVTAAISAILSIPGVAWVQTAHAQTESVRSEGVLQEVIVTATRRAERLQDIPESITAFDSQAIAIRGLQQMDDYARLVPGLAISEREPGGTTIVFRGVTTSGLQFGSVSSSGLYLDEQPITQSGRSPDPRLIDIERVEALRGPQGTLYGASSQSGTLRVITNKADPKGFDAWADAELSSTSGGGISHDLSAMVNVPLVQDKLAVRLVGFSTEDAGFIDRVLSDSAGGTYNNADVADKDVNTIKTTGARASLRWDATDNVNATLAVVFQDVEADGHGDITRGAGDLNQVRFEDESLDDKWYQLGLTINAGLPFADLVVSGSYFDRDFRYEADATDYEFAFNQNAIYYDTPIYDFGGDPRGFATNHEKTHISTVEARLSSRTDSGSRWAWIAGAFYSKETGKTEFDSYVRGYENTPSFEYFDAYEQALTGNPLAPTERWFLGRYDTELDQKAVFGELSFDVTDHFKITAGGRWFDYDRKFGQIQEQPEGFSGFSRLDGNQKNNEDGTVKKLNFTYKLDNDRLLYATYSEGFRVGGSNPLKPASALPRDYKSDELKNYELGLKSEWLDHRLRLNISGYYMEWNDFAVQVEDPQPAVFQLGFVNLPTAEIKGIEAEIAVTFNQQWQLDGALSYNDAKTAGASTLSVTDEDGNEFAFAVADGARLPISPEWSGSVGLEFRSETRLMEAQPFARFDYSYTGSSVNSLAGIESVVSGNPVETQDAYDIGNFRFGLESDRWIGSIFVNNLWDERADLFISNRWKVPRQAVNRPRTVGVSFHYNF